MYNPSTQELRIKSQTYLETQARLRMLKRQQFIQGCGLLMAFAIVVGIMMTALFDAYEYERTGACDQCVLLKGRFQDREVK